MPVFLHLLGLKVLKMINFLQQARCQNKLNMAKGFVECFSEHLASLMPVDTNSEIKYGGNS